MRIFHLIEISLFNRFSILMRVRINKRSKIEVFSNFASWRIEKRLKREIE